MTVYFASNEDIDFIRGGGFAMSSDATKFDPNFARAALHVWRERTAQADYFSAGRPLATNYAPLRNAWTANPDTTNPWTISELDGLEIGVKSIT